MEIYAEFISALWKGILHAAGIDFKKSISYSLQANKCQVLTFLSLHWRKDNIMKYKIIIVYYLWITGMQEALQIYA